VELLEVGLSLKLSGHWGHRYEEHSHIQLLPVLTLPVLCNEMTGWTFYTLPSEFATTKTT
jgi:hypothetical protein